MTQQTTNETTERELLDDDGENRALRSFLLQYGAPSITVGAMQQHMARSGWGAIYCPPFVANGNPGRHLTKAGAQIWIRHLLSMEARAALPPTSGEAVSTCSAIHPPELPEYMPDFCATMSKEEVWDHACLSGWRSAAPAAPVADTGAVEPVRGTVGDLRATLAPFEDSMQINAAFFVEFEGRRQCRVRPLIVSKERVFDGKWIRTGDASVPYSLIAWANLDERTSASPAPTAEPVAFVRQGPTGTWIEMVDIGLMTLPDKTPMLIAGRPAPTADSAADARWNPTDKELCQMMDDTRDAVRWRECVELAHGQSDQHGEWIMVQLPRPKGVFKSSADEFTEAIDTVSTNTGEGAG